MIYYLAISIPNTIKRDFTYSIELEKLSESLLGSRVLVNYNGKLRIGVVVDLLTANQVDFDVRNYKEIISILDKEPTFTSDVLKLAKWTAEYYFCSLGDTLKAMVPGALFPEGEISIKLNNTNFINPFRRNTTIFFVCELLLQLNEFVPVSILEKKTGKKLNAGLIKKLDNAIGIEIEQNIDVKNREKIEKYYSVAKDLVYSDLVLSELKRKSPIQAANFEEILTARSPVNGSNLNTAAIKGLLKKGFIEEIERVVDRSLEWFKSDSHSKNEFLIKLTDKQSEICDNIIKVIQASNYQTFLLRGVTGSGKTLIYINLIKSTISLGKTALLIAPEISLTPQLVSRFLNFFDQSEIALLHSKMNMGERMDSWKKIRDGRAKLVIGARSAIFAPLKNLGLIITDEEHEHSFKQEAPDPRYNARDLATVRAMQNNAVAVLGSATPSIESFYNAKSGKFTLLEIEERADGANLPQVFIEDLVNARKNNQVFGSFTINALEDMQNSFERNETSIIFLNRRGFSAYLQCDDCGAVPICKHCEVAMTFHKSENRLKCHFCGTEQKVPNCCGACGSVKQTMHGVGTQKVEEEFQDYFKDKSTKVKAHRLDADTVSAKNKYNQVLAAFARGEYNALIGTQMIAKGLDFDSVSNVCVLNADIQLYMPDFRAAERTFQLLSQVSGRAGRSKNSPGKVFIQTSSPNVYPVTFAATHNYLGFYDKEIEFRKQTMYPPFSRIAKIEFNAKNLELTKQNATFFYDALCAEKVNFAHIYQPIAPPLAKLRNFYRFVILIKSNKQADASGAKLRRLISNAFNSFKSNPKSNATIKITVDIDPQSMM